MPSKDGFFQKLRARFKARAQDYGMAALEVFLSAAIGFLAGALALLVLGYDPLKVYEVLFSWGYTDVGYLLLKSTPLIMTAIAFSIPALAGVFNIGGESQLYVGALLGLLVAYYIHNAPIAIIVAILGGAGLGLFIALLRVYRGINEVITAIMVNWIMYWLLAYLVTGPFNNPKLPQQSVPVPKSAQIPVFSIGGVNIAGSFILAVIGALVIYYIVFYTKTGYVMRVSGLSPASAKYAGFSPEIAILTSMLIGGAAAGFGGALLVLGDVHSIDTTLSAVYGLGFTGIGIGLLGRNNPIGIIFAAIFFSGLLIGGQYVELFLNAPPNLSDFLIGVIVIALSIPYAYRFIISWIKRRRMAK